MRVEVWEEGEGVWEGRWWSVCGSNLFDFFS